MTARSQPEAAPVAPAERPIPAAGPDVPSRMPAPTASPPSADPSAPNRAGEALDAHPERFSTLTAPQRFDLASYQADVAGYCAQVIPGRIWQVAQPSHDVPQLSVVGPASFETKPGGTVTFAIKAVPGAPLTLQSADLGEFPNHRTTITIRADDKGVASTPWVATPGTTGSCHILAACPLTSGQVELFVFVQD